LIAGEVQNFIVFPVTIDVDSSPLK